MPTRSVSSASSGIARAGGAHPARQLGERLIRSLDILASYVCDLRRVFPPEICLLPRARHVVRAVDDRLHPPKSRVPRWADLFLPEAEGRSRQGDERIPALVQV